MRASLAGVVLLLILFVYSTFGAELDDLGPNGNKTETKEKSCLDRQKQMKWVRCDANGKYAPLQCNTKNCFCVSTYSGLRVGSTVYPPKVNNTNVCDKNFTCKECNLQCNKYVYKKNPHTNCEQCRCIDTVNTCPEADQVVQELQCPRHCLSKPKNGSKHCIYCMPDCEAAGGLGDDKCDRNGSKSDNCDGICVATGEFSTRKCLQPSLLDGDTCKLPPPKKYGDEQHNMSMKHLKGIKSHNITKNFEPAEAMCQKSSVCYPINSTTGICRSKANIKGPCYKNSRDLKCDFMGRFSPLQCFKNYSQCWCVDPTKGKEINSTRRDMDGKNTKPPNCIDKVYNKCITTIRNFHYKVDHGQFGMDPTSCRKCLCDNGQFNQSICDDHIHNCSLITSNSTSKNKSKCEWDGKQYKHQQVFLVDKCNKCKCLGGKLSGCTRRQCKSGDDTPCSKCRKLPKNSVCGPNGVTYDNLCTAEYCAGFDVLEVTPGYCSIQNPCDNFPCENGLTCVPKRITCGLRRGCGPEQYRYCVNKTELACPVYHDVSDKYKICGTDNRTYQSVCRMILETDDGVEVLFDGPCNRSDCQGVVCGTDGVTYPNKCILHTASPNVRIDYPGACLDPLENETANSLCRRVQQSQLCKIPRKCTRIIKPTDGCCPVCGGAVSIAIDEDGLTQLGNYEVTQDTLIEAVLTTVIASNDSNEMLNNCEIEGYIASTGNLEIIFKVKNQKHEDECTTNAKVLANLINRQGDENSNMTTGDPIMSFLTAGSVLEEEEIPTNAESGAKFLFPPFILALVIVAATVIMI